MQINKINKQMLIDKINKILNSIWFVVLIGIILLIKTIIFYQNTIAITEKLPIETIIGTISFLVVIVCFLCVLPNRIRGTLAIIVDIFLSLLLLGDHLYYRYSNNVLSIAQITNLQYGEEIADTLPMILQPIQILYFVDLIILGILFFSYKIRFEEKERKNKKQLMMKWTPGLIGILIFSIISVQYFEKAKDKIYNKDLQIRESTIFGYHLYDIQNFINSKKHSKYKTYQSMKEDYDQLKEQYQEQYGKEKYNFKGILENKNIIILQLESIQEFVVHKKINGKEITPNLNKFLEENIEISNMHMQSYSTTADSEHSAITSLYPMENGMAFSKYYTNTYDDMFRMVHNLNYDTSYMHGNDSYFWNRGNVYGKLKVKNIALKDAFLDTEYINGFLSDEILYEQAIPKLQDLNKPYLSFIVSASSHTPYELEGLQDRSKVNIDVGKYKGTYFGNYLEAVNYADYAFGLFIDKLKETGLYEDTAIFVFGDHNGINMYNEEMIDFLKKINPDLNDIDIKLNYTRVVSGLRIPGVQHLKIEKPTSKIDIKPTIAYLLGAQDNFSLGMNIFESKEFVALNNERIITNKYYYDECWYDIETGNAIEIDGIDYELNELLNEYEMQMKTELEISNSIILNNLLEGHVQ